jgi:hypothetical protein
VEDYIKVGEHLTYSNFCQSRGVNTNGYYDNILATAYRTTPLLEPYDEDGNVTPTGLKETSPVLYMKYNYNSLRKEDKLIGDAYIEIQLIKRLIIRSSFSMDLFSGTNRSYTPIYNIGFETRNDESKVTQDLWNGKTLAWDNSITYDLTMGKSHLNFLAGMSAQRNNGESMWAQKYGLLIDSYNYAYLSNAKNIPTVETDITGGPYAKQRLVSYFAVLTTI